MKLFSRLYVLVMQWARHKYAPWYLAITAFIESIFWPIPVDVMLAPMALGKPHRAWHYAALATLFSVLGALFGYLLGYALWEPVVQPLVTSVGYEDKLPWPSSGSRSGASGLFLLPASRRSPTRCLPSRLACSTWHCCLSS